MNNFGGRGRGGPQFQVCTQLNVCTFFLRTERLALFLFSSTLHKEQSVLCMSVSKSFESILFS
jgi:hypothetical protein